MASEEIATVAVIDVAAGKEERFREVLSESIEYAKVNEPETLQFTLMEQKLEDGSVKLAMFERYANKAALEKHEASDQYKKLFQAVIEEQLTKGPPTVVTGNIALVEKR